MSAMNDWQIVIAFCAVCTLLGGAVVWAMNRHSNVVIAEKSAAEGKTAIAELFERLRKHELEDAKSFVELKSLAENAARAAVGAETRLAQGLAELRTSIEGLSTRIDQFMKPH